MKATFTTVLFLLITFSIVNAYVGQVPKSMAYSIALMGHYVNGQLENTGITRSLPACFPDSSPTYNKIINALNLITENLSSSFDNELRIVTLRINYDNDTLKSIDSLIEDIKHLDKKKVSIHLERVWQTKGQVDEEQDALLNSAIRKLSQAGFNVGIGIFGIKDYSCPAEKYDYAIINYNGNVYRCNGRNLTEETAEGELMPDGTIEWKANALSKRLGKTTFENPMCLSCQFLPACMGPCSQKCMERGWEDLAPVCSLNALDMSLDQYLSLWAEREFIRRKEEILQDSILNS